MKALLFLMVSFIPCLIQAQSGGYDYNCQGKYQQQLEAAVRANDSCSYWSNYIQMIECMLSSSSNTSSDTKAQLARELPKFKKQYTQACNGAAGAGGKKADNASLGGMRTDTPIFVNDNASIARAQLGSTLANHSAQNAANTNQRLDRLSDELEGMKKDNMEGLSKDEYEFLNDQDVRRDLKNDIFNDANLSESLPNSAFYKSKLENLNKSSFAATNALAVKPNNSLVGEYDLSGTKSLFEDAVNTPIVTQPLKAFLLNLLPSRIGVPAAFGSHLFTNLNSVNNMGNGMINELMDALSGKTPPEQSWTNVKEVIENNIPYVGSLFRFAKRFL